jgi:hypothetical protein
MKKDNATIYKSNSLNTIEDCIVKCQDINCNYINVSNDKDGNFDSCSLINTTSVPVVKTYPLQAGRFYCYKLKQNEPKASKVIIDDELIVKQPGACSTNLSIFDDLLKKT